MRVQHPKKHFSIIGRFGNFKLVFVSALVAEGNVQSKLTGDQVKRVEPEG